MIVTFYCIEYSRPPVLFNYLDLVKGGESPDGRIRYYFVENGTHGPPATVEQSFRLVSFNPMIGRALDYLLDWIEKDLPPLPSTGAELSSDYSLIVPKTAAERKGIQLVIASIATNDQSGSVNAHLGEAVRFDGVARLLLEI
ncbi:MAG: hypothetical protein OEZ48_08475 [Candidatus Bathyarchaeota archaeon]|nr:hypothetical protein [Candidatus Bathyarchaeota archaeon]